MTARPSTRIRRELTCDDWRESSDRTAAIRRADKIVGYVRFCAPFFAVHMGGQNIGAGMTRKTALDTAAIWLAEQEARR